MPTGTLYGVSVGTGDPELITIKGLRLLQNSPVVAFPCGSQGQPGMAQKIISQWLKPEQVQLPLSFPYVQDSQVLLSAWQKAAQIVGKYLQTGLDVVFASVGDVSFYSTFTYLAQTVTKLYPHVTVMVIPGVCSPMAAAAVLGRPLTIKDEKLAVLPAIYSMTELETALDWAEVVVLMKVNSVYSRVWKILQQRDLLKSSSIVEKATSEQMVVHSDLTDLINLKLPYFSILIVQVKSRHF